MATKHEPAGWTYYTWDVDESLKTIRAPTVTLESKYNSRMQRVWRSENGTTEKLIYDAQKLIAEATSTGTALNRYYLSAGGSIYSPLLAQLGSEHWFLADALGTTLGLTSETGSLTDTFKYEAFGTSLGRTGTTVTPYQYVGGYGYFNEPSVGLEQVGWRWLQQPTGRWLSLDLVEQQQRYSYAVSLPTYIVDPTGNISVGGWRFVAPPWAKIVTGCGWYIAVFLGCQVGCSANNPYLSPPMRLLGPTDPYTRCELFNQRHHLEWNDNCVSDCFLSMIRDDPWFTNMARVIWCIAMLLA